MQVIKTKVSGAEILIQTVDVDIVNREASSGECSSLANTEPTSITNDIADAFDKAKSAIFGIAEQCGEQLNSKFKQLNNKPSEFALEFSLSLAEKGSIWIVSGEISAALKVSMKWTNPN